MNIRIVAEGLDHPECVTCDSTGELYCGGENGQLYSLDDESSSFEVISQRGGLILGICVNGNETIYACDSSSHEVYARKRDGTLVTISRGTQNRPMRIPNFPVLDEAGNLYVSDSGSWPEGGGCLYRINPSGETVVWTTQAHHFTNGLALSPDGDFLWVVESLLPGVSRIPILSDGSAGKSEIVCLMPGTVPDGLAFDQAGRLFISCYRPDRVYRLDVDGTLAIVADDFQGTAIAAPTNIVFAGAGRKTIYVASLGRWHIAAMETDVSGVALRYPANSYEGNA